MSDTGFLLYAGIGFVFALMAAGYLYRDGKTEDYVLGTFLGITVWVAWPLFIAFGIVMGIAFLLFSGTLLVLQLGWQQAKGWWYRQPRIGRRSSGFSYRVAPLRALLERPRRD